MDSKDYDESEEAFQTLEVVCKEYYEKINYVKWSNSIKYLASKLIIYMSHNIAKMYRYSIACFDGFVCIQSMTIVPFLKIYIEKLLSLAWDDNDDLRKAVCMVLHHLLISRVTTYVSKVTQTVNFLLIRSDGDCEKMRSQILKFCIALFRDFSSQCLILKFMEQLMKVLMNGMRYTLEEAFQLHRKYSEENIYTHVHTYIQDEEYKIYIKDIYKKIYIKTNIERTR